MQQNNLHTKHKQTNNTRQHRPTSLEYAQITGTITQQRIAYKYNTMTIHTDIKTQPCATQTHTTNNHR